MSRVAHLIRGDVRHFRWPILIWIVLVAADTILTGLRPATADPRTAANLGVILGLLWFARQVGMLLLVPLIIQAHPAVGTDAFWMTRPLPPLSLATAKTLLIAALLLGVPAIAQFLLMWSIGVPSREAVLVTIESTMTGAAWLSLLAAGAVVTLNLPRFALLGGVVFLAVILFLAIALMRAQYDAGEYTATAMVAVSGQPVLPPPDDPTQGMLFLLGATVAGLTLVALQYRTRLRRVSVPAGIGIVALLGFALPHWPYPLLRIRSALPPWTQDAGAAELRADSPVIEMQSPEGWVTEGAPLRHGTSRVTVSGLPAGWVPLAQLRRASLTLANGSTLNGRARAVQSGALIEGSSENPDRVVARQVLGVAEITMPPQYGNDQGITVLDVPAAEIDPLLPTQGAYRGDFAVFLTHWELAAVLPIRRGEAFQDGSYRFAIDGVNSAKGDAPVVRAREWQATSSFDRKPRITYAFYVRNAQHTHAMAGYESDAFGGVGGAPFDFPFGFSVSAESQRFFTRAVHVFFPARYGQAGEPVRWEPEWNAGAELLVVRQTEAGKIARTLEIPQVSVVARPNR